MIGRPGQPNTQQGAQNRMGAEKFEPRIRRHEKGKNMLKDKTYNISHTNNLIKLDLPIATFFSALEIS